MTMRGPCAGPGPSSPEVDQARQAAALPRRRDQPSRDNRRRPDPALPLKTDPSRPPTENKTHEKSRESGGTSGVLRGVFTFV